MSGEAITPREPVSVNVGGLQKQQIVLGATVAGAIGLAALISALTGNVDGGTGTRITAFVLGLVFTAIGALPLFMWRIAFRERRVVLDADGLHWDDPTGSPWTVHWPELARVTFSYPGPGDDEPKVSSVVNIDLRPAERSFRDAHPEMEHLVMPSGGAQGGAPAGGGVRYRLPLGNARSLTGPIDRALTAFAPEIYRREGPEVPAPRARPRAAKIGVAILGCYWGSLMVAALAIDGADLMTLVMVFFWTSLFTMWLLRVWAGGTRAVSGMAGLAKFIGVLGLILMAMLVVVAAPVLQDLGARAFAAFLPGLATSAVLLVSARLLSRDDVREWCASRGWGW